MTLIRSLAVMLAALIASASMSHAECRRGPYFHSLPTHDTFNRAALDDYSWFSDNKDRPHDYLNHCMRLMVRPLQYAVVIISHSRFGSPLVELQSLTELSYGENDWDNYSEIRDAREHVLGTYSLGRGLEAIVFYNDSLFTRRQFALRFRTSRERGTIIYTSRRFKPANVLAWTALQFQLQTEIRNEIEIRTGLKLGRGAEYDDYLSSALIAYVLNGLDADMAAADIASNFLSRSLWYKYNVDPATTRFVSSYIANAYSLFKSFRNDVMERRDFVDNRCSTMSQSELAAVRRSEDICWYYNFSGVFR